MNASGTYNTVYYYANNELVVKKEDGAMSYYHNDHLGGIPHFYLLREHS